MWEVLIMHGAIISKKTDHAGIKKPARVLPVIFTNLWLPGTGSTILTGSELDVLQHARRVRTKEGSHPPRGGESPHSIMQA